MKTDNNRKPQFYKDGDGNELARMPLARAGTFATLDAPDLRTLLAMGVSTNWHVNMRMGGYVVVNIPGKGPLPVARLVMGAADGERVTYKDEDKLNLRNSNLTTKRNHTPRVDLPALMAIQAASRKAQADAAAAEIRATSLTAAERRAQLWANLQKDERA